MLGRRRRSVALADSTASVDDADPASQPSDERAFANQWEVMYVGKARNLRARLRNYFRGDDGRGVRIRSMVRRIARIDVIVTHTEAEALLLEANLIKRFRPRYNVVLRDDKSYPYIRITGHEFPRITFHRGARKRGDRYFGPYPSAGSVRATLEQLAKLFAVRQCEDSVFANRSRPCLQHQIERCTAPCVGLIEADEYRLDVEASARFLSGRNEVVISDLVARMEATAARLEFEKAARLRNQISRLRQVSQQQYVAGGDGDADVLALAIDGGLACLQVGIVRGGQHLGHKTLFPTLPDDVSPPSAMASLIAQYYAEDPPPPLLLVQPLPDEVSLLVDWLGDRRGGSVRIVAHPRGERARWLEMVARNAQMALATKRAEQGSFERRFTQLAQALRLSQLERVECFDISHTQGERTVASCVVFGREGAIKTDYRRYHIEGIEPGDDYAAMHQALMRRFSRLQKGEGKSPDLLLIDGGKGQVARALEVLQTLELGAIRVVGVAKGEGRKPGLETLIVEDGAGRLRLDEHSPALHLVQQVRDEAHRFAITGHRARREKARRSSELESIPGLGPKRRGALLKHFGGLKALKRASVDELTKVPGIHRHLAQAVYEFFHPGTES
ncbi:MAG: excinuclease ABC subunit UvrC [Thioalkalivibrionaceae bacterium]